MLQVLHAAERGGAEQVTWLLLRQLEALGTRTWVLFLRDGSFRMAFDALGTRSLVASSRSSAGRMREIRALVAAEQIDVVHTHGLRTMLVGNLAARLSRRAAIVTVTTLHAVPSVRVYRRRWKARLDRRLEALAARRITDTCVANCEATRRGSAPLLPGARLITIDNAVDLDCFRPATPAERLDARLALGLPPDALVVSAVGRLVPVKGHRHLVAALPILQRLVGRDVHVVVAGAGPLLAELRAQAEACGVADTAHFPGGLDHPWLASWGADIAVYPSERGVIGLSALESMACGLPLVASALTDTTDFISPGRTGVLVPPGDPAALADALARLITDEPHRCAIAAAGRRFVTAHCSPERMGRAYLELYESLLADRRGRRQDAPAARRG